MTLQAYAVGAGSNVAENSLTILSPQPASPKGVVPADMQYFGDKSAQPVGFENETLIWSAISQAERNAVLSLIGLTESAPSAVVTMMILTNSRTWVRMNGTAIWERSTDSRAQFGLKNLTVILLGLEAAS